METRPHSFPRRRKFRDRRKQSPYFALTSYESCLWDGGETPDVCSVSYQGAIRQGMPSPRPSPTGRGSFQQVLRIGPHFGMKAPAKSPSRAGEGRGEGIPFWLRRIAPWYHTLNRPTSAEMVSPRSARFLDDSSNCRAPAALFCVPMRMLSMASTSWSMPAIC